MEDAVTTEAKAMRESLGTGDLLLFEWDMEAALGDDELMGDPEDVEDGEYPDYRVVPGLAEFMREVVACGATIYWSRDTTFKGRVVRGICFTLSRKIVIHTDLYFAADCMLLATVTHEICHLIVGMDEMKCQRCHRLLYGGKPWYSAAIEYGRGWCQRARTS
jgi:hypothetical protein